MLSSPFMPIRANPLLSTSRMLFILHSVFMAILLLFFVALFAIAFASSHSHGGMVLKILANEVPFIGILLINSLNFTLNFQQWRYWRRIEQRRIAVVRGDRSLLAAEQPVANAAALALPSTFTLGYKMRSLVPLVAVVWIFFFLYCGFLGWWVTVVCSGYQIAFPSPLLIGGTIAVTCIFAGLPILILRGQRHVVEVSEIGITMNMGRQHSFVRWQEARLFAVYYSLGAQRNQSSLTYELSSMTDIVRWTEVVHLSSTLVPQMTPGIPLREYQQQIQALNALVLVRTGLPLCDLRKEPALNKVPVATLRS